MISHLNDVTWFDVYDLPTVRAFTFECNFIESGSFYLYKVSLKKKRLSFKSLAWRFNTGLAYLWHYFHVIIIKESS